MADRRRTAGKDKQHKDAQHPSLQLPTDVPKDQLFLQLLSSLSHNLQDNTRTLRRLESAVTLPTQTSPKDTGLQDRKGKVVVELKVSFLRILDIDTLNQRYNAEVFIQARWAEPALKKPKLRHADLDLSQYWQPRLVVCNIDGELDEDHSWQEVLEEKSGYPCPIICSKRRIRGRFSETLELHDFPLDVQELTLSISSERSSEELDLIEDRYEMSEVYSDTMNDTQEWKLYSHVDIGQSVTARGRDTQAMSAFGGHPQINITCHVVRKSGYFILNALLILFLLSSLSYTTFAIDASKPQSRLGVMFTLLLTIIAFKFTLLRNLPPVSYLTYLDVYLLAGIFFMAAICVESAVVSLYTVPDQPHTDTSKTIDHAFMITLACVYVAFHLVFLTYVTVNVRSSRSEIRRKEKMYKEKKQLKGRILRDSPDGIRNNTKVHPAYTKSTTPSLNYHSPRYVDPGTNNNKNYGNRSLEWSLISRDVEDLYSSTLKSLQLQPPTEEGVYEIPVSEPLEKVTVEGEGHTKVSPIPRRKSTRHKRRTRGPNEPEIGCLDEDEETDDDEDNYASVNDQNADTHLRRAGLI